MMFCVGIFQEPLALDVEIIECTRSGKRSTIACYAWVSGPPVSPSRVRPGNMAEKPARHTSLPTIAVLLESFFPSEFLCVFILQIYHTFVEKRERGDMTTSSFLDSLKCIFASKIWIVQKIHEPWRLPPARRWWCMVRFTVFGACWRQSCERGVRNGRLKTGSNLLCFYTNYIPMISNKVWTFVKRMGPSFAKNTFNFGQVCLKWMQQRMECVSLKLNGL